MNKKLTGALLIIIFALSSVSIITIGHAWIFLRPSFKEDPPEEEWNFYDEIGNIYNARTSDGVTIKVLRYHAPGKDFNNGGEPILLFPGIMENINQYLMYTTPDIDEYFDPALPNNLEEWAQGDENIEEDPLLYYSVAYYLWKHGYDPWFANYRGVGYGSMKSSGGDTSTNIDDFAIYDVPAAVKKVYELTGQHPYIGGHSTGGFSSIIFLQGCKYSWTGHVYSDSWAVAERNGDREGPETVKGFIGIEPAWIPSITSDLDILLVWMLLDTGLVIDTRALVGLLLDLMETPIIGDLMEILIQVIFDILDIDIGDLFLLMNVDITNTDVIGIYYFLVYAIDTVYFLTLAQYADYATFDRVREYYKNGWFNNFYIRPPQPRWGDGYYYYDTNIYKFKVPAIFFFASHQDDDLDLVNRDKAISGIVEKKSNRDNDECYVVHAAHVDLPGGLSAPVEMFPRLGTWLDKN